MFYVAMAVCPICFAYTSKDHVISVDHVTFYIVQILAVFAVYLLRLISMNKFQLIILSLIVSMLLFIVDYVMM